MPFVLDTSVAAAWCLDEGHAVANFALNRIITRDRAYAPLLFWFELRNAVLMGVRRNRVTLDHVRNSLDQVATMTIAFDPLPDESRVLDIAIRHNLTFYDASYLELAMRSAMPLATLDAALARAADAERIPLLTP